MQIRFWPNTKGTPQGKLADGEIHFTEEPLVGLKLVGFAVWEARGGRLNVTFPARSYTVDGERRSYALLRAVRDEKAVDALRDLILAAFADQQRPAAPRASTPAPRREPHYEYEEPRPRATGTTGRRPAFPRSAMRAFHNRHED